MASIKVNAFKISLEVRNLQMEEEKYITLLKKSDETALESVIRQYTGYVSTVIANQLGGFCDTKVVEELASDVFFALWQNRRKLSGGHLRGWLAAVARNKAKDYIRGQKLPWETLEEDMCFSTGLFDALEKEEQRAVLDAALQAIRPKEREIILRYYYYNQTVSQIARDMKLNQETAKSRLQRGRKKLKDILQKGGYFA